MIFKKIRYIVLSVIETIINDLTSGYSKMSKPKEILKGLFWLLIIAFMSDNYYMAKVIIFLYIAVYIWLIIKRAEWRKKIKESALK